MFRFKQFTVVQPNAAMKVCTDACLFGSLIDASQSTQMLDIGTGTGLLSLMLCQKNELMTIDAVEIDPEACLDASKNFEKSPFKNQINLHSCSIQDFAGNSSHQYDLIISNPPFYKDHLLSPDLKRNQALHGSTLSLEDLIFSVKKLLSPAGNFWLLLPPHPMWQFYNLAENQGLFPTQIYRIKHNENKPIFREIACFGSTSNKNIYNETIKIYENEVYSDRFAQLLKDYYLIF